MSRRETPTAVRFSTRQRAEHLAVMLSFVALALTGFPQKFHDNGLARTLVDLFGGLDRMRLVHRVAGITFALLTLEHMAGAAAAVLLGRASFSLVPARKDFRDAVVQLRYYLGLSEERARFDRFDYKQKFEYWGLVLGGLVMIVTGLVLFQPTLFARYLPGELIPAAKVAHSNEGLMAFLVVITWHIYNAHLAPEVFPFDTAIFTGRVTLERMRHEHPLEYERLAAGAPAEAPTAVETPATQVEATPAVSDA